MLGRNLHQFPRSGRMLDVAGGSGHAALILAARGLSVTVADISEVALGQAAEQAEESKIELTTSRLDFEVDPFPPGPWDLITCFNYLNRDLFPSMIENLTDAGGMLAVSLATKANLERHERPSERFLLDEGELPTLLDDLTIVFHREGWSLDGRHRADAIAKKRPDRRHRHPGGSGSDHSETGSTAGDRGAVSLPGGRPLTGGQALQ